MKQGKVGEKPVGKKDLWGARIGGGSFSTCILGGVRS